MASYGRQLIWEVTHGKIFSTALLFEKWVVYPFEHLVAPALHRSIKVDHFDRVCKSAYGTFWESMAGLFEEVHPGQPVLPGRLAGVIEGGGKRRLFVIGNYVKQQLLKPYHDWAMTVLRSIPNDGTFNQTAPLRFIRGGIELTSLDLKSATDRWPSGLMFSMMAVLFGEEVASAVVVAGLSTSRFLVGPPLVKHHQSETIRFVVGQPLGYHSSWALFALCHHLVVWWAAERAYPREGLKFTAYTILGDDIVIGDSRVASEYRQLLNDFGVEVSYQKSLFSDRGGLEFAKRFLCHGGTVDLSPISLRALVNTRTCLGLLNFRDRYGISNETVLYRLAGAGYKTLGKLRCAKSAGFRSRSW